MTDKQHEDLLKLSLNIEGTFQLSGYRSEMYDDYAAMGHWRREEFKIVNNAAGGKTKRTMIECLWMNYQPCSTTNSPSRKTRVKTSAGG
jgi:hypothetical protein